MNAIDSRDPHAVQQAIATYFAQRKSGGWPISVAEGVASIRRWNPHLDMTDSEIVSMVADYAVGRGLNLYFDRPSVPRPERHH